jgi:hypothetical protein
MSERRTSERRHPTGRGDRILGMLRPAGMRGTLLLLLAILILPVLVVQALVYQRRFEAHRAEEYRANLALARAVGRTLEAYVSDVLHQQLAVGWALTDGGGAGRLQEAQARLAIIDRNGRGVYRYPEIDLTWEQRDWLATQPIIADALAGGEVIGTFVSVLDQKVRMTGLTPVRPIGGIAGANRPEAAVLAPVRRGMVQQFGILVLAAATSVVVAPRSSGTPPRAANVRAARWR